MDVIILCGGKGTRLSEETVDKPKPLVEIDGMPILWHIMKSYSMYGFNRFILCLGYKGHLIKDFFVRYNMLFNNIKIGPTKSDNITYLGEPTKEGWEINCIDTGVETLKGARLKKIEPYIKGNTFMVTYGDGVTDLNLNELVEFHNNHKKLATVTAVKPPSRFGEMLLNGNEVTSFEEKSQLRSGYINGGYFVFNINFLKYLTTNEHCDLEFGALQEITKLKELRAYKYDGFWQCMDNIRERNYLNEIANNGNAPWLKK